MKKQIKSIFKRFRYTGVRRHCPVCNFNSRVFLEFGVVPRADALCPMCYSLERHRLTMLFFREETNLFDGKKKHFLHVAPESTFVRIFADAVGDGYLTADLTGERVMEKMDITDIQHPEGTFDVIYCSHVLEHVADDRKAIREFYRVLKPEGWAVINVPITAEKTFEDPSATTPEERTRLFGQYDHVRRYGPDYENRLIRAGFQVTIITPRDLLSDIQIHKFGLSGGATGDVFYCTK